MDMETYRKKHGLNKSGLVELAKSPEHYEDALKNPKDPTPAMLKGTHFHTRILEPDIWAKTYVADPKMPKRSKADKAAWEQWQKQHEGLTVVPQEEIEEMNLMREAVMRSKTARGLLTGGTAETSVFWEDPVYGFQCKLRADYLNPEERAIVDIKTASNITKEGLQRAVSNFNYHWQDFWYKRGMNVVYPGTYEMFVFIFVETKRPYSVVSRVLDADSMKAAQKEIEPLLHVYNECFSENRWPGIPDEIDLMGLPPWRIKTAIFD